MVPLKSGVLALLLVTFRKASSTSHALYALRSCHPAIQVNPPLQWPIVNPLPGEGGEAVFGRRLETWRPRCRSLAEGSSPSIGLAIGGSSDGLVAGRIQLLSTSSSLRRLARMEIGLVEGSIFRVLVLGDFHFGESYSGGGRKIIRDHGYGYSTKYLRPFFERADKAIVNLETPLANRQDHVGKFSESKTYVHWADPAGSAQALAELGVDAVGLANNHTMDLGDDALEATLEVLNEFGISSFGAGSDRKSAERPYRILLPDSSGGGELQFYAFFEFRRRYRDEYSFYARKESPGCALFSRRYIPSPAAASSNRDPLRIAFPHWGQNYVWRSEKQEELALKLLSEGYDMVLGHGAHSLQEIHRLGDRWVAYSIGNGNFQSPGRWAKYSEQNGIVPFGLWTMLEVRREDDGRRRVASKYYPVYLDNRMTNFQPRPVNKVDFGILEGALRDRQPTVSGKLRSGEDDLGYFIEVHHGNWNEGRSLAGSVQVPC